MAIVSAFTSSSLNGGAAESLELIPEKDSSSTGSDPATSASSTALSCFYIGCEGREWKMNVHTQTSPTLRTHGLVLLGTQPKLQRQIKIFVI